MNINDTYLEEVCKDLLQLNLSFEFNDKPFKQGKLIIFQQKNFHINFILENDKKIQEKIEIPIPYKVESHLSDDGLVYFDYRLKTLSKNAPDLENYLRVYGSSTQSNKFWNSILCINTSINPFK